MFEPAFVLNLALGIAGGLTFPLLVWWYLHD